VPIVTDCTQPRYEGSKAPRTRPVEESSWHSQGDGCAVRSYRGRGVLRPLFGSVNSLGKRRDEGGFFLLGEVIHGGVRDCCCSRRRSRSGTPAPP